MTHRLWEHPSHPPRIARPEDADFARGEPLWVRGFPVEVCGPQAGELAALLDEYAHLQRESGFDANSWEAGRRRDGDARQAEADEVRLQINAGLAALSAQAAPAAQAPEGFVIAPDYRGYALLGIGQYVVNHSDEGSPAELVISIATEGDKAGRVVGEDRDNPAGAAIQAEDMAVRIRFENEAGLAVLEKQLAYLREVHFPAAQASECKECGSRTFSPAGACVGCQSSAAESQPVAKYDDVLVPFLAMMRTELHANSGKGDRPGWLTMDRGTAMLEIYHHAAKLAKALRNDDSALIQEHAADVANMAMMVVDVCGELTRAAPTAEAAAAPAPQAAPESVYAEARQCNCCSHAGINDSKVGEAACKVCEWQGPEPAEDACPGCGEASEVTAACPECGGRYYLIADGNVKLAAPTAEKAEARPAVDEVAK